MISLILLTVKPTNVGENRTSFLPLSSHLQLTWSSQLRPPRPLHHVDAQPLPRAAGSAEGEATSERVANRPEPVRSHDTRCNDIINESLFTMIPSYSDGLLSKK